MTSGFADCIERYFATNTTIVNKGERLNSPANIEGAKEDAKDLCWKVHDLAQSFVFCSYTMHDYVIKTFLLKG